MKKINNKGFALTEVLIATVFIAIVFTFIYMNTLPTLGSYEKEEMYDTIETKYVGHIIEMKLKDANTAWMARQFSRLEYAAYSLNDVYNIPAKDGTKTVNDDIKSFNNFANIKYLYLTTFDISEFKNKIKNVSIIDKDFREYVGSLPSFNTKYHNNQETKNGKTIKYDYRLIIYMEDMYGHKLFGTYKISENGWSV